MSTKKITQKELKRLKLKSEKLGVYGNIALVQYVEELEEKIKYSLDLISILQSKILSIRADLNSRF